MTIERAHELTNIDKWFLSQIIKIAVAEKEISDLALTKSPDGDAKQGRMAQYHHQL